MSDAVTVRPKDWVPFRCRLCGSCCRNLRGNLMPEQLDAYRLARFLRECKQSSKMGQISPQSIPVPGRGFARKYTSGKS